MPQTSGSIPVDGASADSYANPPAAQPAPHPYLNDPGSTTTPEDLKRDYGNGLTAQLIGKRP